MFKAPLVYIVSLDMLWIFFLIPMFIMLQKYGIKPNFAKERIRPSLIIFFVFLKKIAMTGSSANQMDRANMIHTVAYH